MIPAPKWKSMDDVITALKRGIAKGFTRVEVK